MSRKYEELAHNIIELIGGKDNINNVYHCQTRLRFKLKDESLAKQDQLNQLDGVAKCLISGGVFQVVIGTHVASVFEEIEKIIDLKNQTHQESKEKKGILNTIIDFVSGTFQPIIPALSGAGMVKAVLALLVVLNIISNESQTYYILNFFADAVFYFLPILLAFSEAQKLRCNPILAASIAGIMMHPNWGALVAAGESVSLFGAIPFTLASYTGTVIPIIIVILVQSYVEKYLNKFIHESVKLIFVPLLTFLIMGTLALSVLGPIGTILGNYLADFFNFLSINAAWAPAVLIGGFLPIMVMFGLHNGVAPLGVMQMSEIGHDSIFGPGCLCSNIAQATAGLVVSLRTKNKGEKQLATSGSITAYMGITEPILYGVNLPKKYPLIAAMIGGGCGGLYAGLTHTHRFATGSSGLPAVLLYIGDDTMKYFYNIIIALIISAAITAVLTYFLSIKYETNYDHLSKDDLPLADSVISSPLEGTIIPLDQVLDEAFSSGALGKGIAILPTNDTIVAPFDGEIIVLFPTKHAIGIRSLEGVEILIHIGIDTVNLNGEGFESFVHVGQEIKKGDPLVKIDLDFIKESGYSLETPIIITNHEEYQKIEMLEDKTTTYKKTLLTAKV